jgi:type IV pili sensor histidine kinase/response regulator
MYSFQQTRVVPLAFLIALLAGCAHQQPSPQPSESERLAADYPDAENMALSRSEGAHHSRVVATGLDQPTHEVEPDVYRYRDASRVEVMRNGRYALVTANATLQQRNLLEQTVNVSIPASMSPSVEDGLRYTLQHTGYSLCAPQGEPQQLLYSRPLPAAHFRLGPMPLREALQVLAGSAFEVQADPISRTSCYQVRDQRLIEETGHDG